MPFASLRTLALASAAGLLLAGSAYGQSTAPLSTMPMPPSASDPAPKETAKKKPTTERPARKRASERSTDGTEPATAPVQRRSNAASTGTTTDRTRRIVPQEYESSEEGSRAKPFVTESGRPGMGMRF